MRTKLGYLPYAFLGPEILRFARTTHDGNTVITLADQILKRMQKEGSKHKFILAMVKEIFTRNFSVLKVFADVPDDFIKLSSLH